MADSVATMVAQLRPSKKKVTPTKKRRPSIQNQKRESVEIRTRLKESGARTTSRFKVILIQEGLGNLGDCFYYTKECLRGATSVFEGVKCYADHPNQIESQVRPERSTRDIIGHFERVEYREENGRAMLMADLVLLEGAQFEWAKSLLTNAIEYSKKYQDADFVGLSINAQGEASTAPILDFVDSNEIPESALTKLRKAMADGIDEIRPVAILKNAVSVDLVTEAGAGGRILTMMERNKAPMKKKTKVTESEGEKKEGEGQTPPVAAGAPEKKPEGDGGKDDHADAQQDEELFKKMIDQYLGPDHGFDQEETMSMAKHAYGASLDAGKEGPEAYEAAGNHLKLAAAISKRQAQDAPAAAESEDESHESEDEMPAESEDEAHESEDESEESEDEGHHESAGRTPANPGKGNKGDDSMKELKEAQKHITALQGEVAGLKESNKKLTVERYLEAKIASSDRSPEFVKSFKEALGKPRSEAHIEEMWTAFTKAYDAGVSEGSIEDSDMLITEKGAAVRESAGGRVLSFADCAE